jgi:hypothetical protein
MHRRCHTQKNIRQTMLCFGRFTLKFPSSQCVVFSLPRGPVDRQFMGIIISMHAHNCEIKSSSLKTYVLLSLLFDMHCIIIALLRLDQQFPRALDLVAFTTYHPRFGLNLGFEFHYTKNKQK